jgi:hypothetical protein
MAAVSTRGIEPSSALSPLWVRLALLGSVSGGIAWGLLFLIDTLDMDFSLMRRGDLPIVTPLSTVPGLVFGVCFGAALWRIRGLDAGRLVLYVVAAGIGYLAAFHAAFFSILWLGQTGQSDPGAVAWVVGGLLGGLAGSLVLGLASLPLLRVPAARVLGLPLVVGTVAGALLVLLSLESEGHGAPKSLLAFFALWQGAYAASLAPLLRPEPR